MAKKFSPEWWQAQRPEVVGRETEKIVSDLFREQNNRLDFAWHRFPDAKAARGALAAQPADFLVVEGGRTYFVELKALKHPYRLPRDRVSQLAVLRKFEHAGAVAIILVFHYLEGVWRMVNASNLEFDVPSWDLREVPAHTSAYEALFGKTKEVVQ